MTYRPYCRYLGSLVGLAAALAVFAPREPLAAAQGELDVFMERVLQRRDENRVALHSYVLDEAETFELLGPARVPLQSFRREFTWYVRDGHLARSPVRFDGVAVGETRRREYEENWFRQERRRNGNRQRQPRSFSRRSTLSNVTRSVERLWGSRIGRGLARDIAEDAQLWRDDFAAIVAAADRISADLGGVKAVGFGRVAERARDGFVMLEGHRLDPGEVAGVLAELVSELAGEVAMADATDLEAFIELIELAAIFELSLPELDSPLEEAHAAVSGGALSSRASALDVARRSLAAVRARGGSSVGQVDAEGGNSTASESPVQVGLQPRFVSEAYFLDFQFEPGNYYFAGRDELAGREVVKIEYYPERLFSDEDDQAPESSRDEDIEAGFDKTSLVTLWIDPEEHQIVKFTFDNVGFEFLPMRWLVRLDDLRASMVMGQPIEGVWLPEKVELTGQLTMANGSFTVHYTRDFSEYRQAEVRVRIRSYGPPQE